MIFLTRQGVETPLPDLFAYSSGVWCFPFTGDETYADPVTDEYLYYSFLTSDDMGKNSTDNSLNGAATDVTQGTGPFDKSAVFNGASSRINCGDIADLTNNFTFTGWFNLDVLTTGFIFARNITAYTDAQYSFRYDTSVNQMRIGYTQGAAYVDLDTGFLPAIGTDYFYVLELRDGIFNLYINNNLEYTNDIGGAIDSIPGHNLFIGARSPGAVFLDGTLAEFRIFDRVLTADEMTELYENNYIYNADNVWTWEGTRSDETAVLRVRAFGDTLTETLSVADCITLDSSFFWDTLSGVLYIHWPDAWGDWAVGRSLVSCTQISAGYASKYNPITKNVYSGLFYAPIITALSGYEKKVDPQKLGLISFRDSTITLSNQNGRFDGLSDVDSIGVAIQSFYLDDTETEIKSCDRVSTGTLYGYTNDRAGLKLSIIENRLFENKPICPNTVTLDDYPDAGDYAGKLIPVAWGKIRRGRCQLVNANAITTAGTESTVLLISDPALGEILSVDALYDEKGNSIAVFTEDLTACTITFNKTADVSPSDIINYTWRGQGYDIDGDYSNGLDIIKDAFLKLTGIPFIESTYNRTQWNIETAANTQSVGISIQSDKGFFEELIEPIATSLQGSVIIEGDGRINYKRRDTGALVKYVYEAYNETIEPALNEKADEIISELLITYAPDFTDKDNKNLSYTYLDDRARVVADYGIDRREPISPLRTVLTEPSDVEDLASTVMQTASVGESSPVFEKTKIQRDINIFDIIGLDVGRHDNPVYAYGEVLQINPDYLADRETIRLRLFDTDPNLPLYLQGRLFGTVLYGTPLPGYTRIEGSLE